MSASAFALLTQETGVVQKKVMPSSSIVMSMLCSPLSLHSPASSFEHPQMPSHPMMCPFLPLFSALASSHFVYSPLSHFHHIPPLSPSSSQRSINDSLIGYMRVKYIGTKPYVSSTPHLCHVSIADNHKFLVLSSDGLFRHQSVDDVAALVKEGSSAKGKSTLNAEQAVGSIARLLVEKALTVAAKKNGRLVLFWVSRKITKGDKS